MLYERIPDEEAQHPKNCPGTNYIHSWAHFDKKDHLNLSGTFATKDQGLCGTTLWDGYVENGQFITEYLV